MKSIILFTNNLNYGIGGMETHQKAFISYFESINCELIVAVLNNKIRIFKHNNCIQEYSELLSFIDYLNNNFDEAIFFFNNLSWIREIPIIRQYNKLKAKYIIRSGGNDILRAPLNNDNIPLHYRQRIVVDIINKFVDFLIVNSNYSFANNVRIGINQDIMKKVRGGVDSFLTKDLLRQKIKNRKDFNEKYHIGNLRVLSIVARFVDFKGIIEFLDYYRFNYCKYFLLLVGDGTLFLDIKEKMKREFPENYYTFTGAVNHDEAMKYISISDVLLNPSIEVKRFFNNEYYIHTETMGRTMMEAVCLKVPILALNSGGTKELFEENSDIGICTNSWNNLNNDLIEVIKTETRYQSDYSWEKVFTDYLKLFAI